MTFTSLDSQSLRKGVARVALLLWLVLVLVVGILPASSARAAEGASEEISLLFTHDMHSHFDADRHMGENGVEERGGFGRLKTAIDAVREDYPNSFLLDGGDFSMGTLYQTVFSSEASELRMMGRLGFDATTLGNHEFDYRAQGLTDMFTAAEVSGEQLPAVTIANIDWEGTLADEALAGDAKALQTALDRARALSSTDYLIIERGGVKAAVFGIFGKESDKYAPLSGILFKDPIETAKEVVAQIQADGQADIIICLSHSGTSENPNESEDELLAKAVPDIDVIISGHTHTYLEEPLVVGNTLVVSCGEHTYNLGHLTLTKEGDRYAVSGYELIPIDESLAKDEQVEADIEEFRTLVEEEYLSQFGYEFDEVLAHTPFPFTSIEEFAKVQGEDTLGNLISDSYIAAVKEAEGSSYVPVDVAIVPSGVIRGSFATGDITVADAFIVSSLGIGPDRIPGYPLVSIYLTGAELKTVAEIDISVSTLMSEARLYMSGLSYTYNPNRIILNRVTNVQLMGDDGSLSDLDDEALYRVIGGLYSCQMLSAVEAKSFGILKVVPKDAEGTPISDFEEHIVYDGTKEVKEWAALANYLASFDEVGGTPQVPEYYNELQGRKVEVDSLNPVELLKNLNTISLVVIGVVVLLVTVVVLVIVLVVRKVRKSRAKRANRSTA